MAKRIWLFVLYLKLCKTVLTSSARELVSCRLGQTCVLPCRSEGQLDQVRWTRSPGDYNVHVYVNGTDELRNQYWLYSLRTSLSEDLSRGDASLLISQVTLKDQGTFRCSTISSRGEQNHSLELTVFAPVLEVFMEQQEQQLLCRSEGIYPEPSVIWTPSIKHNITVTESEQGLFSVISSVTLSDSEDKYICNVGAAHSWKSAVLKVKELKYELNEWSSDQDGLYTCLQKTDSESVILRLQVERPNFAALVVSCVVGVILVVVIITLVIWIICLKQQLKKAKDLCDKLHGRPRQILLDLPLWGQDGDEGRALADAHHQGPVGRYRPVSRLVHLEELNHNSLEINEADDPLNIELEEIMSNHRGSMGDSGGSFEVQL